MTFEYILEDIGAALDDLIQGFLEMWNNIVALLNPTTDDDDSALTGD